MNNRQSGVIFIDFMNISAVFQPLERVCESSVLTFISFIAVLFITDWAPGRCAFIVSRLIKIFPGPGGASTQQSATVQEEKRISVRRMDQRALNFMAAPNKCMDDSNVFNFGCADEKSGDCRWGAHFSAAISSLI
jgi:hypothetical protein